MSLYKNKYRVESARLHNWDYGAPGYYFVTICTYKRVHYFGQVKTANTGMVYMALSDVGEIAMQCLVNIPKHCKNTILDEFVIMPNHVHCIIRITNNIYTNSDICGTRDGRDAINRVSTRRTSKLGGITGTNNPMLKPTLGTIVRWFKGRVSFECHSHGFDFAWQPRFHDRIIWNAESLYRAQMYIKNNPKKWHRDRNNPPGLYM